MRYSACGPLVVGAAFWSGSASPATASDWRLAGTTYNSVAFVDLASVAGNGSDKSFTAIRVSGQPAKDGWKTVVQRLKVDCATRIFVDFGSVIEQHDGTLKNYPASGASQKAASRGVFSDMFEIVCGGRSGTHVADPKIWALQNFKVGG